MTKAFPLLMILLVTSVLSKSQVAVNYYRLFLTDKNYSSFSVDNPEEFLSKKAIQRRIKQDIEIKTNDLPVSKYYTDSLIRLGLQIRSQSKWMNSVVIYSDDHELTDTITSYSFIRSKQKAVSSLKSTHIKNNFVRNKDVLFVSEQTNLIDYGYANTQISMLNGHVLHRSGYQGTGVTIAVIDAGFYKVNELSAFDSLFKNNLILGTRDFVDGDREVFDASSHGMKVLSTMGSHLPGQIVGTAPKANYWLLRSEQTGSENSIEEDYWVAAAEFADSVGCDIISSSLGYSEFDDSLQNYFYANMDGNTTIITKAADVAASKGMLVVNSAGNLGDNDWLYISAPADGDSVLAVGAVDEFAQYVYFSSIGPSFDGRIKPNVSAMGYQTTVLGNNGETTLSNGTSFSAPLIAGMAACLWQCLPELNNFEILKKIEQSAHQYSNPDFRIGYGIPDFAKAANLINTNILTFTQTTFIKVYPNPFENLITIELSHKTKEKVFISLFSIMGNKIVEQKTNSNAHTIITLENLHNLPAGIYILQITVGSQLIQKRISKTK